MIIYKDKFSGDELVSDCKAFSTVNGVAYKFPGKKISITNEIADSLIGGNASADGQGEGEGTDSCEILEWDIVCNSRLVEYSIGKKDYQKHLKEYMKRVKLQMTQDGATTEELDEFSANITSFIKDMLAKFKELTFFVGESMSEDGMMVIQEWDGAECCFYFFKHGLIAEKV